MILAVLLACTSEPPEREPESASPSLPAALVASTWQVRMADATARAPYEQAPGWALLFNRDLEGALQSFEAQQDDGGRARVHLELAALYRQAARLAAEATLQVYGADRQETDPPDVDYLVGVSEALLATPTTHLERTPADPVYAERVVGWRKGTWPTAPPLGSTVQTRELHERTPDAKAVPVLDPGELLGLSLAHENEAIRLGAPPRWLDPWRLPMEPATSEDRPVSDEMLFGGFVPTAADVAFLSSACDGNANLERFPDSVLATLLAPGTAGGRLDVQKVRDAAQDFSEALRTAMRSRAGQEEGYQRTFAELGRLSVLRAAVCVADDLGQGDDGGVLRVEIADLSSGPARDPVFLVSLAAWDAAHRNAVRALDLVHTLAQDHPQLELARVPLDAMSVRLSRNSAPAAPVH
jgi:hypothetical protein